MQYARSGTVPKGEARLTCKRIRGRLGKALTMGSSGHNAATLCDDTLRRLFNIMLVQWPPFGKPIPRRGPRPSTRAARCHKLSAMCL